MPADGKGVRNTEVDFPSMSAAGWGTPAGLGVNPVGLNVNSDGLRGNPVGLDVNPVGWKGNSVRWKSNPVGWKSNPDGWKDNPVGLRGNYCFIVFSAIISFTNSGSSTLLFSAMSFIAS
jgi:hypothetical protein